MPRMRLLKDIVPEVKAIDSNTAVTTHFVRELALSGKIRSVTVGTRRRLIDLDSLLDYLKNGDNEQPEVTGKIRPVKLRA